tara:strand:+ start:1866 stop:2237 length:372 start_codon:yes stop_codon:yes gene_type:complete
MKIYFYNSLIVIFLIFFFEFPEKIHKLYNTKIEQRLMSIYGYCYPQGYGFIKDVKKNYKLKNVKTINFKDFAQSDYFINNPKFKDQKNYKILINYDPEESKNFSLDGYKILFVKENCFLIKND